MHLELCFVGPRPEAASSLQCLAEQLKLEPRRKILTETPLGVVLAEIIHSVVLLLKSQMTDGFSRSDYCSQMRLILASSCWTCLARILIYPGITFAE